MKHLILFIAVSLIYYSVQAQNYFQQTIDDTSRADEQIFLNKIIPAPNGNFLVTGYEEWPVGSSSAYKAIVMMVDSSGNMIWNKLYNSILQLKSRAIVSFPEGFYVLGSTNSQPILMKLDLEGNVIESHVISNSDLSDLYLDNMVAYNGGILLSGHGEPVAAIEKDIFLFKIDGAGNLTALGHHNFNTGFYVTGILADDNNFYLIGWMFNDGNPNSATKNGIVTGFNQEGNVIWSKKFKLDGGYGRTFVRAGNINEDHTINIVYDASDLFGYFTKIGLCRIDSNGNFLLEKEFATSLAEDIIIEGMSLSKENEITICAGNPSIDTGDTMVVFRYDEDFNIIWSKSFDHVANQYPLSLAETEGGNLMIAGYYPNAPGGVIRKITADGLGCNGQDFFLENFNKPLSILDINNYSSEDHSFTLTPVEIFVSSPLVSYFGCDTLATAIIEPISSSIQLFPNPFNNTFRLTTNADCEVSIYDVAGRPLESHKNVTGEFTGGEKLITGIYFIEIKTSSGDREILKAVRMER